MPLGLSKEYEASCRDEAWNYGFSRVCTRDSDNPSSWEMKDDPALKSLYGNPALFLDRASRFLFHLRPESQGPTHIPIAESSLLLGCLWKLSYPLELKAGNQLSSRIDLGYTELFLISVLTPGSL